MAAPPPPRASWRMAILLNILAALCLFQSYLLMKPAPQVPCPAECSSCTPEGLCIVIEEVPVDVPVYIETPGKTVYMPAPKERKRVRKPVQRIQEPVVPEPVQVIEEPVAPAPIEEAPPPEAPVYVAPPPVEPVVDTTRSPLDVVVARLAEDCRGAVGGDKESNFKRCCAYEGAKPEYCKQFPPAQHRQCVVKCKNEWGKF